VNLVQIVEFEFRLMSFLLQTILSTRSFSYRSQYIHILGSCSPIRDFTSSYH